MLAFNKKHNFLHSFRRGSGFYVPEITLPGIYLSKMKTIASISVWMFSVAFFVMEKKNWKHAKCPVISECLNKLWCIPTRKYYTAIKRNNLFTCAQLVSSQRHYGEWTKSLSKCPYCVTPLSQHSRSYRKQIGMCQRFGWWGWLSLREASTRVSSAAMKLFCTLNMVVVAQNTPSADWCQQKLGTLKDWAIKDNVIAITVWTLTIH